MKLLRHFSAPSSRSSSNVSLNLFDVNEENNENIPNTERPEDMISPDIDNNLFSDMPTDTEDIPSYYKKFTHEHPLGNLLMKLTSLNLELCKKNNIPNQGIPTLGETCGQFVRAIQMERGKVASKVNSITSDIEDSILNKELNYHSINQTIGPPLRFSTVPVITSASKLAEVLKAFPSKSNLKFSGSSNGVNIIEFLSSMNQGQEIANLSRSEFLQVLLKCVSGKVYNLISECITHDGDISNLYYSLLALYDRRMSSTDARKVLASYKAPRNSSITKVQTYILETASRIASALPKGPSRTSMFNLEANSALVRCLPASSSTLCTNIINTLTAKLQRQPSFVEVTKCLTKFADTINNDIERNGAFSTKIGQNRQNNQRNFRVLSLNQYKNNNNNRRDTNNNRNGYYKYNNASNNNHNGRLKVNTFGNRKFKDSPRNEAAYNINNNNNRKRTLHCSLCGQNDHEAINGCFKMRDDQHRLIQVIPSFRHCNVCLEKKGKKLFHPSSACISRDIYIKMRKKEGKRWPIIENDNHS